MSDERFVFDGENLPPLSFLADDEWIVTSVFGRGWVRHIEIAWGMPEVGRIRLSPGDVLGRRDGRLTIEEPSIVPDDFSVADVAPSVVAPSEAPTDDEPTGALTYCHGLLLDRTPEHWVSFDAPRAGCCAADDCEGDAVCAWRVEGKGFALFCAEHGRAAGRLADGVSEQ